MWLSESIKISRKCISFWNKILKEDWIIFESRFYAVCLISSRLLVRIKKKTGPQKVPVFRKYQGIRWFINLPTGFHISQEIAHITQNELNRK